MDHSINPYVAGNPVGGGGAFVGRTDVLDAVLRVLRDPQHRGIVLYGQRRIGKTSILLHLLKWLPEHGGPRAIYFDLQDKAGLPVGKILVDLARTMADALDLPDPQPGPDPEAWFRDQWLPLVLGKLPQGSSVALLLDEFDVLTDADSQRAASVSFFSYLRQLLDKVGPRLRLVIVIGRNIEDLNFLAGPLFKTLPSTHISLLHEAEAGALLRLSEKAGSLSWTKEAIGAAWALTHGHPYLLQHLAWQIWARAQEAPPPAHPVTEADVNDAVPSTLDASRNALEWLWGGLPPAARVVAAALAKAGDGAISEEALHRTLNESGVRVVIRELRDAPRLLQEWDILEAVPRGHRFRVELLRRWIARFKPLERVQEELDRIEPLAETLYKAGEGFYKTGNLESSLEQLRKAIEVNPNHLRAHEMLAEIFIARRAWGDARTILEKLAQNYPAAARPRLIQVLLAQAGEASTEADALAAFDRVLAVDGRNSAAIEGKRKILKERGDRARTAGKLDEALEAYREAGLAKLESEVQKERDDRSRVAILASAGSLEKQQRYDDALRELTDARELFAGSTEWKATVDRLEQKKTLEDAYERARAALNAGDKPVAISLLARIIGVEPAYKDVPRLLYEAVSGQSIQAITADARREQAALQDKLEEARQGQAALQDRFLAAEAEKQKAYEAFGQAARERHAAGKPETWIRNFLLSMVGAIVIGFSILMMMMMMTREEQAPPALGSIEALSPPATACPPATTVPVAPPPAQCPQEMALFKGGKVWLGSSDEGDGNPVHLAKVSPFCLDKHEVTSALYKICVDQGACSRRATGEYCPSATDAKAERKPANCVTWSQAATYCMSKGMRLPTADEWEFAARDGREGAKYLGNRESPGDWLCWNGDGNKSGRGKRTSPCDIGEFPFDEVNDVSDLAGNVAEWTTSQRSSAGGLAIFTIRGGHWRSEEKAHFHLAHEFGDSASRSIDVVGFRCATAPSTVLP